ncbi:phosphoribosylformylglycinamidine synthase [Clostridiales bacterium oral taxon 876 str. F0540]|nr:phosphoribosylformylglycinamidine synthase [Clostridiales bacterium oral taxon 876 str. F0540]
MDSSIRRLFVEKKPGFDVEAQSLFKDLRDNLFIKGLNALRIINRYDVHGIQANEYEGIKQNILSEKTVDYAYDEVLEVDKEDRIFGLEYLKGQYDQRADWAEQCIQLLVGRESIQVKCAKFIVLKGNVTDKELEKIKEYCINPVDSKEASIDAENCFEQEQSKLKDIQIINNFIDSDDRALKDIFQKLNLAMSFEDLVFSREYFKNIEKRNPSITELKVIDTYWSDHCRHTTFNTSIKNVHIHDGKYSNPVYKTYEEYLESRKFVYEDKEKSQSLMDIAVIGMKELRKKGLLNDLDISEEINACSIEIDVEVDEKIEKWLLMFKNETHNHPTEIEPFGGAATCLGGAIRDPLSGRAYVYQAMRVTGSGDPRQKLEDTIPGKLPQRKITIGAASGYSSYGNQIGLATGQVTEVYDDDFIAKRMEIGAVVGAAPKENVVREKPQPGDIVVLIGGRTGRDGCGGATGSSKEHDETSIVNCSAEVQKGNAPTERKLQRLFRNKEFSRLIKRCNDFGAGGVSVAIGELADGLDINLDNIPKKYEGLDGTELAISESQERMAVVIAKENKELIFKICEEENLEAAEAAFVTDTNRLRMSWKGDYIVDISREFLDTNGVRQTTEVEVVSPIEENNYFNCWTKKEEHYEDNLMDYWKYNLQKLNICSEKGLVERFDSTIGASTILMPFGGRYQSSPSEGMAAKIPVLKGNTNTASIMTFGYNPLIGKWSPYHGALYSVVEAVTKVAAMGGDYRKVRLSMQEYFEKLGKDALKWGKPFSALLGALKAQKELEIAAIGGKDSMSGTYKELNVPPTLVAFAVCTCNAEDIVSAEFKKVNSKVVLIPLSRKEDETPDFNMLKRNLSKVKELADEKKIISAISVKHGGISEAISKMCFGNKIGFKFAKEVCFKDLFEPNYGSLIVEIDPWENIEQLFDGIEYEILGTTKVEESIEFNEEKLSISELYEKYEAALENIFHTRTDASDKPIKNIEFNKDITRSIKTSIVRPKVFIPIFPGTNCEYDSARAFEKAGGIVESLVFNNLTSRHIEDSIEEMVRRINASQIIMIPGGFSAGDEPEGSGKFITAVFRNKKIQEAVMELLKKRDGLMLGICNGFQALIKLGLLPYGEIRDIEENNPTLTYNEIGRHVSKVVKTKITSNLSPWFSNVKVGDIHWVPVSHGEGRFIAREEEIERLIKNGQIAAQYVDFSGNATYDINHNPNGSCYAVEAITSPDGRILGKMAHSERVGENLLKNIPGNKNQKIFESGIDYFK